MSIRKMQFRCTPRGTTEFLHESIDRNSPSKIVAQLGNTDLQSLQFSCFEIINPPSFWSKMHMRTSDQEAEGENGVPLGFSPLLKRENKMSANHAILPNKYTHIKFV